MNEKFQTGKASFFSPSRGSLDGVYCRRQIEKKSFTCGEFKVSEEDIARPDLVMAATSSGRRDRPTKFAKGGTDSGRKHRFESFSQRIAKLNIDPIHKVRRQDVAKDDIDSSTSFFTTALAQWKDLNLSTNFTAFHQEVEPLCSSLPQILHHHDKIVGILLKYLEMSDVHSLEPLFSLVSHLAHDMGARFEQHFAALVDRVVSLAARHPDVEVIEWSFTCLAWLFKYLSRLLVPDLRPLFDIMAPLLGKEIRKPHIMRFAAESLSFLIRKAALGYHKNAEPLKTIVTYVFQDLSALEAGSSGFQTYQQGIMTLFADAIKGINEGLHSRGITIYQCLVDHVVEFQRTSNASIEALCGLTINIIHHTNEETFHPILEVLTGCIRDLPQNLETATISFYGELLFIATAVRQGSRVQDWQAVIECTLVLLRLEASSKDSPCPVGLGSVQKAIALSLTSAPLNIVIPRVRPVMDLISSREQSHNFLLFCTFLYDLGRERFQSLISPYFFKCVLAVLYVIYADQSSRYLATHWEENETSFLLCLHRLLGSDCGDGDQPSKQSFICPRAWQERMAKNFHDARHDQNLIALCNAYLGVVSPHSVESSTSTFILENLTELLYESLSSPPNLGLRYRFSLGSALSTILRHTSTHDKIDTRIWSDLCLASVNVGGMVLFLENLTLYCGADGLDVSDNVLNPLISILIQNLASPSGLLRTASLRLMSLIYKKKHSKEPPILTTALAIENTPFDIPSVRTASMHVRRLASQYQSASLDPWLGKAIPYFCFGLLTVKLAQLWEDAVEALKGMCQTQVGEDATTELLFQWLAYRAPETDVSLSQNQKCPSSQWSNEFQCSNVAVLNKLLERELRSQVDASKEIDKQFEKQHDLLLTSFSNAPSQALRILKGIPYIAEKRSRLLVPMLLNWAVLDHEHEALEDEENPSGVSEDLKQQYLPMKDRKAMLDVFALCVNPRVLFRSSEVYSALKDLLMNGDIEIQKAAFKAILTWKPPGVLPYQENLTNLLDDSRFREEISVFLSADIEDNNVQLEHRAELMPILLRILYGRVIAAPANEPGRRRGVVEVVSRLSVEDQNEFLMIALGPLRRLMLRGDEIVSTTPSQKIKIAVRKQLGLVNMLKDMAESMGGRLVLFSKLMINAILYCMTQIGHANHIVPDEKQDPVEGQQDALRKTIRQVGFHCLAILFKTCPPADMKPYLRLIFSTFVNPRLENFAKETAQSVSGLLRLFAVWAANPDMACYLTGYSPSLLTKIVDCLEVPSAKDEVKLFVLDHILKPLVSLDGTLQEGQDGTSRDDKRAILVPHTEHILAQTGVLLRRSPSKAVLGSAIELVSMTATMASGSSQVESLLEISAFLLDQPSQRVNPKTKGDLLSIVQAFTPLVDVASGEALLVRLFNTISSLFGYFKDCRNRVKLSAVLAVLAQQEADLTEVAQLCIELNAFSTTTLDEPDFDRRLKAFIAINETCFKRFTAKQWRPLVYNMLYYVKDTEELAIRMSASFAIRRFVEMNSPSKSEDSTTGFELLKVVVLPAVRDGAYERSELVRAEYLSIMAHIIRHNHKWSEVSDMSRLLVEDDEEASFFNNVLHIQQHRRLRALRRLATEASCGMFKSANVAHFLAPLIEHFIFDRADDEGAHDLAAETINTIGALAEWMDWPQVRAMLRRYSSYMQSKPELEKAIIKVMGVVIDAIGRAALSKEIPCEVESGMRGEKIEDAGAKSGTVQSTLSVTMPRAEKFSGDLTRNILPSLMAYLHNKDESTVSLRVPVAISIVKLLKLLPQSILAERLPPILTDVCHILRSRAQESRDMTRKTLVDISALIGPAYFGFVLKELRSSLARGYQLHVLSYTVHSILVATTPMIKSGSLDYCLPQIVAIIMDDIFGGTGQEKDAEEYISKMKEVKSSKSFDSMELVAKIATISHLSHVIRPLQTLLQEKLDLKMVKKVDELLRRISVGLLRNETIESRETLIFCYEILQEVYKANTSSKDTSKKEDYRVKRYLLSSRGKARSTFAYNYKLCRFSLDVLRTVLHKYDSLQTPANLSGFMPVIGDAVLQAQEEVQISALRLLATIIKVPLTAIDDNAPIYVAEAVKMIRNTVSTNTELAQAALKLVSAVLKDRKKDNVRESDLAYLLKRLTPDLEEPDRQGVTFNFLRAVISRRVVIPEVYEVMDTIATMMVTSQSQGARDAARGVYFQFLVNYPQGRDRLSKQLGFLVKNLDYKHVEGRQSVMEAVHLLLSKIGDNLVQEIAGTFFVPLIMVTVNDDSLDCRKMAGTLLKDLFERADDERAQTIIHLLRSWIAQDEQILLIRIALQTYRIYLDVRGMQAEKEVPLLQNNVARLLKGSLIEDEPTADWELVYVTLETAFKLCQVFPKSMFKTKSAQLWSSIRQCLHFPHAWVKASASKLLGLYFADFARTNADQESPGLPLQGSGGLRLTEDEMIQITQALLGSLRVPGVGEDLANQCARNLLFLGRFLGSNRTTWTRCSQGSTNQHDDTDEDADSLDEDGLSISDRSRGTKSALQHIFERLSAILRREPLTTKAPSLIPKTAALQLLAALCSHLPLAVLSESMETILLPLHNLTDPSIAAPYSPDEAFRTAHKALVSTSQEIMASLQKKLGTTDYVIQLSKVRGGVKARREERRVKRRLEVVAEPEKVERYKKRKGEKKKDKRKERSLDHRSRRLGY